jgi:hypothetical protein
MCKTYDVNPLAPAITADEAGCDLVHGRVDMAIIGGSRENLERVRFVLDRSGLVSSDWLGDGYLICTAAQPVVQ